jgi:rod shape-determining protein MreD
MRGAVALFITLYVLRAAVAELNSALSATHLWLFAGGLFVTYSALAVPFRQGFVASVLAGLLCDSVTPVAFGTHAALFAAAHAVVFNVRERLQRDETAVRVVVALIVNAALFLAITLTRLGHGGRAAWPRMASDLAWSELVLAIVAPWFFALQLRTLELARANPSRAA